MKSLEMQGDWNISEAEVKNHNFDDTIKHFKLEEDYAQNPEKYKEMKEDFEKYLLINLKMDLLEEHIDDTIDTTDKKIVALKDYMAKIWEKAEKSPIENVVENLNPEAKAENWLAEKTGLKWLAGSGIGAWVISVLTNIKEGLWIFWGFFTGMLSKVPELWFLSKLLWKETKGKNEDKQEQENKDEKETEEVKESTEDVSETDEKTDESKIEKLDTIENRKSVYNKLWSFIVREMWGKQIRNNDNPDSSFEIIEKKWLSVSQLKNYNPSEDQLEKELGRALTKKQFDLVKNSLIGPEMEIIFDSLFSTRNLQHLWNRKRSKEMIDNLWLDINNFDWRSTEIDKLLVLLPITLSGFTYLSANSALGFADDKMSKIINFANNPQLKEIINELDAEVKEFEENVMSVDLGKKVATRLDSNTLELTKEQLDMEGEQIERFLSFRDLIVSDVLKNPRYNLDMQEEIISSFSLSHVFQLYVLFWWNIPENIETIDAFNSNIIYTWIFSVLENRWIQWKYGAKIQEEIVSQEFVKEADTALMQVMIIKIMEESFDKFFRIWQKAGSASLEVIKNNPKEAWLLWLAVFLVNKVPLVRGLRFAHKLILLWWWAWAYAWLWLNDNIKKAVEKSDDPQVQEAVKSIKEEIGGISNATSVENNEEKDGVDGLLEWLQKLWDKIPEPLKDTVKDTVGWYNIKS